MSKVEKAGEHVGSFSSDDKAIAKRALHVYMDEINGTGFRWEFDRRPSNIEDFLRRDYFSPNSHFRELERVSGRIRKFGGFVTDLTHFQNRPVTSPHPLGWDEQFKDKTITRVIDESQVNTYRTFHDGLVVYSEALGVHGPSSSRVAEAATHLAQLVNPQQWREAGYPVPDETRPITGFDTRWYLSDVMRATQS